MTTQPPQPEPSAPIVDEGNALLCETPAQLTTMRVNTPVGQRLAATIRTPSTTLTVFLDGTDARTWAAQLTKDAASVSAARLVVADGAVAK